MSPPPLWVRQVLQPGTPWLGLLFLVGFGLACIAAVFEPVALLVVAVGGACAACFDFANLDKDGRFVALAYSLTGVTLAIQVGLSAIFVGGP